VLAALPEPVLVIVVDGQRLRCELANSAWLTGAGLASANAAELVDLLPRGRAREVTQAMWRCVNDRMPTAAAGISMVPQGDRDGVDRVVCTLEHGGPTGAGVGSGRRHVAEDPQWLVDHHADFVGRCDRHGVLLHVGTSLAELYGLSPSELLGDLVHAPTRSVPGMGLTPESGVALQGAVDTVFHTGKPSSQEVVYVGPHGSVPVRFRLLPEHDSAGQVVAMLLVGRDIGSVPIVGREPDNSHTWQRDIFDNAFDQMALLEVCPDGRFRFLKVNPSMERAMGRSRDEAVGRYQDELFAPNADRTLVRAYRDAIDAGKTVESELTITFSGGTRRYQSMIVPERDESGRITRVVSISRDITDRKSAELSLRRVNIALQTLSNGNMVLVRAADEPGLLSGICQVMVDVGEYRRAWIGYQVDGQDYPVALQAWASSDPTESERETPDPSWLGPGSLISKVMSDGQPVLCHPGENSDDRDERTNPAADMGVSVCLIMPLRHNGNTIGVFAVQADDPAAFEQGELTLLVELGADLAFGIQNVRTRAEQDRNEERLLKAMNATIQALADTTELRDPYTAGHQRRVAQLAEAVGRELGLSEDRVAGLYLASTIHDIGKISVPAEILSRPGQLSDLELQLMQLHASAAYDLLRGIEFPWPVADIVAQHHERCDGSGYPAGLTAEEILLESRILAVCDVVEAMFSHRPYRPSLGMDVTIEEIVDGRGSRYDANVVDATVSLLRSGRFRFT
jgi:PAS domain S-box-containing protein